MKARLYIPFLKRKIRGVPQLTQHTLGANSSNTKLNAPHAIVVYCEIAAHGRREGKTERRTLNTRINAIYVQPSSPTNWLYINGNC